MSENRIYEFVAGAMDRCRALQVLREPHARAAWRAGSLIGKLDWGKRAHYVFFLCLTTVIALQAQTFTTLHSFDGTDGAFPFAGLIQATDGNFYGTTYFGGINDHGTVFRITPSGKLKTLYKFCSKNGCSDGARPSAGLVQASDGDLYGTTSEGRGHGKGTVFKITRSGTLTTLHTFEDTDDGDSPKAGLIQASDGNFYGTTYEGGTNKVGTVFKITPRGKLTTLHSFSCSQSNCPDGAYPYAGLVQASDGHLYGTTRAAGYSEGTVFKMTINGKLKTIYSFCPKSGCRDGVDPHAGLVQATDGNLYGTTASGGPSDNGTVFKITPNGKLTTLHGFCSHSPCLDGGGPDAGLVQASDGSFYGTTFDGGTYNYGTIFKLSVGLGSSRQHSQPPITAVPGHFTH